VQYRTGIHKQVDYRTGTEEEQHYEHITIDQRPLKRAPTVRRYNADGSSYEIVDRTHEIIEISAYSFNEETCEFEDGSIEHKIFGKDGRNIFDHDGREMRAWSAPQSTPAVVDRVDGFLKIHFDPKSNFRRRQTVVGFGGRTNS
jgi:hypothetical protein